MKPETKKKAKKKKKKNIFGIEMDSGEYPVHEEYAEQGDMKT